MVLPLQKPSAFTINIGIACIILFVATMLLNRALMIGSLVGILYLLFSYSKIKLRNNVLIFCGLSLLLVIIFLTLFVKSDSSLGRLLIYKISWNMFIEHPLIGIGWGNFQRDYGLQQALFFETGNYTDKEFLLAGNTFYAFNDYWQFMVETGIIGASCLLLFIFFIVRITLKAISNNPEDHFLKLLTTLIIVIGTTALFTHVMEHKAIRIIIVFAISYIFLQQIPIVTSSYFRAISLTIITIAAILYHYYFDIKNYSNYRNLELANNHSATGYVIQSQKIFAELYPKLKNDIGFLKNYNDALAGHNNNRKKIFLLKQIMSRYTDNISYLKIAYIYEEIGMYNEAEFNYLKSVHIVPNRFIPKEALFNFYLRNKQYKKAAHYRKIILSMPIKVNSKRVENIKQIVKNNNQY